MLSDQLAKETAHLFFMLNGQPIKPAFYFVRFNERLQGDEFVQATDGQVLGDPKLCEVIDDFVDAYAQKDALEQIQGSQLLRLWLRRHPPH